MPESTMSLSAHGAARLFGRLVMVAVLALSGACVTVDFDAPKEPSYAIADASDTFLGEAIEALGTGGPGETGIYPMIDGIEALGARLKGAERAERTIDLQYYLIYGDLAGAMLIDELLNAADRGVRVRILVDDVLTKGYDQDLVGLDAHPNIQIRVFNPFGVRSLRAWNFLWDFDRVNRRMHNKSFIVDNQVAIIGGRNIADEYFAAREDVNFGDLDVITIGPVVEEISNMYDLYWNDRLAVPVTTVIKPPKDPQLAEERIRSKLDEAMPKIQQTHYAELIQDFEKTRYIRPEEFTWVPYELVYDSPDKASTTPSGAAKRIRIPLSEAVGSAQSELIILSPYFVPTDRLLEGARAMTERGVTIIVITNSLAANNHSSVHAGYGPWRKKLLEAGVQIFEVRPDAQATGVDRSQMLQSGGTLHTKAFIVDRELVYLGSFNWDPRSAFINTEMGIILESEKFGQYAGQRMERMLPNNAYKLELNDDGDLRWIGTENGERVVYKKEPQTSWWRRFQVKMIGILPIDGQL